LEGKIIRKMKQGFNENSIIDTFTNKSIKDSKNIKPDQCISGITITYFMENNLLNINLSHILCKDISRIRRKYLFKFS